VLPKSIWVLRLPLHDLCSSQDSQAAIFDSPASHQQGVQASATPWQSEYTGATAFGVRQAKVAQFKKEIPVGRVAIHFSQAGVEILPHQ
jgi:hypothetical protein